MFGKKYVNQKFPWKQEIYITYFKYIDSSRYNIENCCLPWFSTKSFLSQSTSQWLVQSWNETIFKIMAGRINISICNVRKKYHSYNYHSVYSTKLLQQSKRITGNFTKSYEISRREAQRFYYENWKMMKMHLKNHSINRNPFSVLMREHYIENMERIMMNSGLSS